MKKWIYTLICLGYFSPTLGTQHDSFLVTGDDLHEISYYDRILETPNFFSRVYPLNLNPNAIIVPRHNSGFMFGIVGYRQRPFDNQLDYAIKDPVPPLFLPSTQSNITSVDPDYGFGYGAYIGYVYPYTGRDIRFDAYFMSGSARDTSVGLDSFLWAPLGLYDRTVTALEANASQSASVDQAQLMTGQQIFAGTRLRLRPSLGIKTAAVDRKLTTTYLGAAPLQGDPFGNSYIHEKSRFAGVGPAVQIDGKYFFTRNFGLTGHITDAILIGTIKSQLSYDEEFLAPFVPLDFFPVNTTINLTSSDRVVPNIDGKIGIFWEYPFCGTMVKLDVELGYDFNHFFNAVDTYRSAGGVLIAGGEGPSDPDTIVGTPWHIKHVHDLTLDGPYLSVGLSGISCPNNAVIDPVCVTVPRLDGGFVFAIGAGYYRIQTNQRDYAILDPAPALVTGLGETPLYVPSTQSTLQNVEADHSYGLMVTLGYIFKHSPYDITVHYEKAQTNDNHRLTAPTAGTIWPILTIPFFDTFESRTQARNASANLKFNYDEVHVDVGQSINASSLVWLRIFEGVQYVDLSSNLHVTYQNLTTVPGFLDPLVPITFPQEDVVQETKFTGIGPRLGFDMTLPLGGFALSSQLAGGFIAGSADSSYKDTYENGTIPGVDDEPPIVLVDGATLGTQITSETQYSPFIDLKVGLAFTWNFFSTTRWTLELGYKAVHYFNAATSFRHVTNNAASFVKQVGDVTIDGPYLNLVVFGIGACPPDCIVREPYCAFIPELRGGLELAVEGLHLQPHAANIDYGIIDPLPVAIPEAIFVPVPQPSLFFNPSGRSKVHVLTPGYDNAFRIHIGYIFQLTANDISFNFVNYNESSTDSIVAPPLGVIWTITNGSFGAATGDTLFPVFAQEAHANVDFGWQTINLELGRRIRLHNLMVRFFTGLASAKVSEDIDITYLNGFANNEDLTPIANDIITQDNSFSGFGPRFGAASDLALGCGFSLVGLVATDLLVGNITTSLVELSSSGDSTALNPGHRTRFVPSLSGKLGLAYSVALLDCKQFSFEFGYEVNHYFNVKDSLRFTDYASTFIKQDQDISFDGPYARLQFNF